MNKKKLFLAYLPDLLAIQKTSFCWFLQEGLIEELKSFLTLEDFMETYEVNFFPNEFYFYSPFSTAKRCRKENLSYSIRLYLPFEVHDLRTGNRELKNLCLCELPLMTDKATFIINGCERSIIGQIVRSPGIYYKLESINNHISSIHATLISQRGSWLYFEYDSDKLVWIKTDRIDAIPISFILDEITAHKEPSTVFSHLEHTNYFDYILTHSKSIYTKTTNFSFDEYEERWDLLKNEILDNNIYSLGKIGRYKINQKLKIKIPPNIQQLTIADFLEIIDYLLGLRSLNGSVDDIDSLENRRIRSIGELLQLQFNQAFQRFGTYLEDKKDFMNSLDLNFLMDPFPVQLAIDEFFATNPLSQYLDQINPLAEIIHKRRVTVLGPGGIPFEKAGLAIRDIHPSYYGRLCPIDTPEGEKAGLVASLATFAFTDSKGFLTTPFFAIQKNKIKKLETITASVETSRSIAMGDIPITQEGFLVNKKISVKQNEEFSPISSLNVDYLSVSPFQFFSPAIGLIPFFEHDDANRTLMGAHMQRQAVPLLRPQKPIVGTGLESQLAFESGTLVLNYCSGIVRSVSSNSIMISDQFGKILVYKLDTCQASNQGTFISQRPMVWIGEEVKPGQILADGPSSDEGELALGKNITVAYMPWCGYNYEDAIVVSERLVYENIFTSIHVERLDITVEQRELGPDFVTRSIYEDENQAEKYLLRNLDENGLVYAGVYVKPGDILVGKLSPDPLDKTYGRLLEEIFDYRISWKDTSFRVPSGMFGRTLDVRVINQLNSLELSEKVIYMIQIFIADIRRLQIGDKMSGRHGNKGVISIIAPQSDLPFLSDGTLVDIVLNPLGVPSRMNVGQLFECLLGWAGDKLDERFKISPFDEMYENEASRIFVYEKLRKINELEANSKEKFWSPGKQIIYDGRTGEPFANPVTIGKPYILKLIHLVDDKIHARSIGPYSVITQQPLGGRSKEGGQRFGEMEVWALEAYGTANTLQELLTIKSDDIPGRIEAFKALVGYKKMPAPTIPESFRVLLRELRALAIDIRALRFSTHSETTLEPTIKTVRC